MEITPDLLLQAYRIGVFPMGERRDDPNRQEQARDREHDVHHAHDRRVDEAADVTGDRAEDESDRKPDPNGDNPDQQRHAGAVHDPREEIAPEEVDAEPVLGRGAGTAAVRDLQQVLLDRIVSGDPRREDRAGHEDEDEDEAGDCAGIAEQAVEGVTPEPARRVALDFNGFDLGDTHARTS
jgi:hypothetical protein